jgi:hypothetical protein
VIVDFKPLQECIKNYQKTFQLVDEAPPLLSDTIPQDWAQDAEPQFLLPFLELKRSICSA